MADKPAVSLAGSEGTLKLTRSDWTGPVNIGSDEMVTINQLADMAMKIAGKNLTKKHIPGPLGVRTRERGQVYY